MKDADYRLMQGGIQVARVTGPEPGAWNEILHYASVYAQDGPCTIERKGNHGWTEATV